MEQNSKLHYLKKKQTNSPIMWKGKPTIVSAYWGRNDDTGDMVFQLTVKGEERKIGETTLEGVQGKFD